MNKANGMSIEEARAIAAQPVSIRLEKDETCTMIDLVERVFSKQTDNAFARGFIEAWEAQEKRVQAYRDGWAKSLCEWDLKVNHAVMKEGEYHKAVDLEVSKLLSAPEQPGAQKNG